MYNLWSIMRMSTVVRPLKHANCCHSEFLGSPNIVYSLCWGLRQSKWVFTNIIHSPLLWRMGGKASTPSQYSRGGFGGEDLLSPHRYKLTIGVWCGLDLLWHQNGGLGEGLCCFDPTLHLTSKGKMRIGPAPTLHYRRAWAQRGFLAHIPNH